VLALGVAGVCASACGGGDKTEVSTQLAAQSNERRLTHAQSVRLVEWAADFRSCVLAEGVRVGPLTTSATRIEMRLAPGIQAQDVLPATERCGERAGGPPQDSSLQYRPGKILLYLPKQCLLDKKVAAAPPF
jgi:hypothetical protein